MIFFRSWNIANRLKSYRTLAKSRVFWMAHGLLIPVIDSNTEGLKMNATTNEARLAGIVNANQEAEASAGTRLAQNSLLSELPGVVFGLITLGYIVSSLIALA
jgi:hypothetical protein